MSTSMLVSLLAAQVLVALGADLSRVRQQVLLMVAGSPAHVAALEATATLPAPARPRCGSCGVVLAGSVLYTELEARPSAEGGGQVGVVAQASTPAELMSRLTSDIKKWNDVIDKAGIPRK